MPASPAPTADDLPVEAMDYTVAEHYAGAADRVPIEDARQFDGDLRRIFVGAGDAPGGEAAASFIQRHYREIVSRIAYWTGESPSVVRSLIDHLARRAADLELRVGGLEASTLIELTAFGTAVVMNHRHTHTLGRTPPERAPQRHREDARGRGRGMKIVVLHTADALDPPVDPVLDQLSGALGALGHECRTAGGRCGGGTAGDGARARQAGSRVQPRRVVRRKERAGIERRGAAQSSRLPVHRLQPGRADAGGRQEPHEEGAELSRHSDAAVRHAVSRRGGLGG